MLLEALQATQDYLTQPSPLSDQITAAGASAWIMQKLKTSKIPQLAWINEHSVVVNRLVSLGFAMATTSGIHAFWHGTGDDVSAGGTFAIVLASGWITDLKAAAWRTGGSYFMQQFATQAFFAHEKGQQAVDTVADVVKDHKEEIAAVVEGEDKSVLKLKEPLQKAMRDAERQVTMKSHSDDWNWK